MNRRQFVTRAAVTAAAGGVAAIGSWRFMLHHLEVTDVPLPIAGLPAALEGATLVQLSDLHIGTVVDESYVKRALALARSLDPDILVFTGDFVTWNGPAGLPQLDRIFETLSKAKIATLAVAGNHDYGTQWREPGVADEVLAIVARHGVQVLRNGVQVVEGLTIAGVDDLWAGMANVAGTRAQIAAGAPSLVLCHNPDVADHPAWSGYRGWMLSGHTHGGQCRAPFCAPPLLPVNNRRYAAGKVPLVDGRTVYVNRGIGHTLPIRVNVRPEVTRYTLVRA